MNQFVAVGIALVVLVGLAWVLYRPQVQQSQKYQAMVVPLANIMDVGFIVLSPAIVLLAGFAAPLVMLGICLLAIATGFAIAYNIRHYEPLEHTDDPVNRVGHVSRWALTFASVINIAYYTLLLITLLLWPLGRLMYRIDGGTGVVTHSEPVGPDFVEVFERDCPGPADFTRPVRGRPLLTEEAIYAPTFDDALAALDLQDLDELWRVQAVGPIRLGPVLDGTTLYVVTEGGRVVAIDTRRRTEAASIETGLSPTGIAVSGDVVVLTGDFGVVAYRAP